MSASVPIPGRSSSPYRDLGVFEEPLITISPGTTPRQEPQGNYFPGGDQGARDGHLHPEAAGRQPRRLSSRKSDWDVALELAREESLMDVDDLAAEHDLVRAQLEVVSGGSPIDAPRPQRWPPPAYVDGTPVELSGHSRPRAAHSRARAMSPNPPMSRGRHRGASTSGLSLRSCDDCKQLGEQRWYCNLCTVTLCGACWDRMLPHRLGRVGPDNVPHEKTDHNVAEKIQASLEPKMTEAEQEELHRLDDNTTWFGVARDEMDDPIFQDYGRYATLMAECSSMQRTLPNRGASRYPSLVSFVGQTAAGKSTLIKMLIELRDGARKVPVPVVGSLNQSLPTSGDVHLFADPETFLTDNPILYADCEGLEGGEREPAASKARYKDKSNTDHAHSGKRTGSFTKKIRKKHHSSQREITWANTPEKRTREFAVTNLYPRLLYTFSDVIVFVLKNPRIIENVIERLIEWASAALEKSTNQPVLPHVIIVLNASENAIDAAQWDADFATSWLLRSVGEALTKPSLKEYARLRTGSNREIRTAEDLLLSYYCSVRVVRIPTKGRPQLINGQVGKLYQEIVQGCNQSRASKRKVRMLLGADELQPYLQDAFDHFSSNLEIPFDFVKASFLHNPIPADFGGNILTLAIRLMQVFENRLDAVGIFKELSPMVASCIMLDSARHKTKGKAESIFREHYMIHCDDAIEDFCDRHWPCEYSSTAGRCVNVRSGHSQKGHQLKSGRTFGAGPRSAYYSTFSVENFGNTWKSMVHHDLEQLQGKLREVSRDTESEEQTASNLHQKYILTSFFQHVGSSEKFISHVTCYSCLIAPPEHSLPCGHILCTPCLQAFGSARGKSLVEVSTCPLWHAQEHFWEPPWPVAFKPASAGIRILTLDGGGVRGIAELEILRLLHRALGGKIPIHEFFDLIVGTSAGGIIALGLGVETWSVDDCISQFKALCGPAFTPRRGRRIFGLAQMVEAHYHSKYETRPLQASLMEAYSDNRMFGGPRFDNRRQSKVAVTATSAAGLQAIVISNYNRIGGDQRLPYHFQRPDNPETELKIWEAARATSAAPTYYRSFPHEPSKQVYLDGGINHNNPIAIADCERKLLWPDMAKRYPDILLSVGSGHCKTLKVPKKQPKAVQKVGISSNIKALYRLAVDHIESSLNSEAAWQNYMGVLAPADDEMFRFQRFNVELEGEPPKLDDVDGMDDLEYAARKQWSRTKRLSNVARHLVATCFFFEKTRVEPLGDNSYECTGSIQCRFPPGTTNTQHLGEFLRDRQNHQSSLYFIIRERYRESEARQVMITQKVIEEMMSSGRFGMGQVKFTISSQFSSTEMLLSFGDDEYYLSGFPRMLPQEDPPRIIRLLGDSSFRTRTGSQLQRRGQWPGPEAVDIRGARDADTISHYSSPAYVIGDSTPDALDAIVERFQQSTLELAVEGPAELDSTRDVAELEG